MRPKLKTTLKNKIKEAFPDFAKKINARFHNYCLITYEGSDTRVKITAEFTLLPSTAESSELPVEEIKTRVLKALTTTAFTIGEILWTRSYEGSDEEWELCVVRSVATSNNTYYITYMGERKKYIVEADELFRNHPVTGAPAMLH